MVTGTELFAGEPVPPPPKPKIPIEGAEKIFAPLPPIEWTCEEMHLSPGRPFMLAGYGFAGKSLVGEELVIASALGDRAFGAFSVKQGPALYVDNEMGARLNYGRLQRFARARGKWESDFGDQIGVSTYPEVKFDDENAFEILCSAFDGYRLVILDSFTTFMGGIEENSTDAGAPLYTLGRVSQEIGATIGVIHHARKPSKDSAGGLAMSIRGSGAIFGACDSIFVLGSGKGEPIRVEHVRSPTVGTLVDPFGLRVVDVPYGTDPRWGLQLEHLPEEQLAEEAEARADAALDRLSEVLFRAVVARPGLPSRNAVVAEVKGNRSAKLEALRGLEACGRVIFKSGAFYPNVNQ